MNKAGRDIITGGPIKKPIIEDADAKQKPQLVNKAQLPIDPVGLQPTVISLQKPKYPVGENGLIFGFLAEETLNNLDEQKHWKDRCAAIEVVDDNLTQLLNSLEKKQAFKPHMGQFLALVLNLIKDINFKICLTAINIVRKVLSLDVNTFLMHKTTLTTSLIEKLSDSKVVIRQAVLKTCGFII